jgi:hypothetical protein
MTTPLPPVLSVDEVAALLRCSAYTVRERARLPAGHAQKLPGVKFGDDWMFPLEALLERVNDVAREALTYDPPSPPTAGRGRPRRRAPALL